MYRCCPTSPRRSRGLLEDEGFALKAIFIIDAKGMVRQVTVNDACIRMSVGDTLRLLTLLQHGEGRRSPLLGRRTLMESPKTTLGGSLRPTGSANNT